MSSLIEKLYPFFEPLNQRNSLLAQRAIGCWVLVQNVKLYDEMIQLFDDEDDIKTSYVRSKQY